MERAARVFVTGGVRVDRITRDALPGDPTPSRRDRHFGDDTIVSANPKVAAAWFVRLERRHVHEVARRRPARASVRRTRSRSPSPTTRRSSPSAAESFDAGVDQALVGGHGLARGHVLLQRLRRSDRRRRLVQRLEPVPDRQHLECACARTRNSRRPSAAGCGRRARGSQLRVGYTFLRYRDPRRRSEQPAPPPFTSATSCCAGRSISSRSTASRRTRPLTGLPARRRARPHARRRAVLRHVRRHLRRAGLHGLERWGVVDDRARHVEIFGRVTNLFDRDYEEALGFPALGRGARCRAADCCRPMTSRSPIGDDARAARRVARGARRRVSSAFSARMAPARRRCCGCSRARDGRRAGV